MKTIHAVIIGKNYSTSLGLIDALGERGYNCAVIKLVKGQPKLKTPEICSKYVVSFEYAKPYDEDVLRKIHLFHADEKIALIPSDDYSASLLDRYFDELSRDFFVPNIKSDAGVLTAFMDKYVQKEKAREFGIQTAKFVSVNVEAGDIVMPQTITYPCYTKPQKSIGLPKSYIRKCNTADELLSLLQEIGREQSCRILVEEAIEVEHEYTVPGVSLGGNVVIPALLKKEGICSGSHKGVTTRGEVIPARIHQETVDRICEFISSIGIEGIFDIELFESNGVFYLNEINLRYSAAGYAVTAAGVNLPGIYMDFLLGKEIKYDPIEKNGLVFVSEKAELEDYMGGYSTWREYRISTRKADIHFMTGNGDYPAQISFRRIVFNSIIRKMINR